MILSDAITRLHPRSLKYLSESLQGLVQGRLWAKVLIAMALGVGTGLLLGPSAGWVSADLANSITNWLALPGQLFLALVKMIIIPLVFASIIRGLASGQNLEQVKSVGIWALAFFAMTTAGAVAIGIVVAEWIQPGKYIDPLLLKVATEGASSEVVSGASLRLEQLPVKLVELLPNNPLTSMVQGEMLQVVIFAAIVGVALLMMKAEQAKPLMDLLGSLQEVSMTVVRWAMKLAPLAVFGLSTQITSKIGLSALRGLGIYVATVIFGLFLLFLLYLVLLSLLGKFSPYRFVQATRDLLLLAFSTSSSAAVMPLSIKVAEEKLKLRPSIVQFVIPLGATINMNGTALYQGVATIFLAQVFGIGLGFETKLLIVATSVGASIGSPATPGVGIAILSMVLASAGIPPIGIALLMGVDRILDMCRTMVNVSGDLVACVLLDRYVGGPHSEHSDSLSGSAEQTILAD